MRHVRRWAIGGALVAACAVLAACSKPSAGTSASASASASTAEPGAPLPGLTRAELARFAAGQTLFTRTFTPAEGLGPLFNETRCSNCHDLPAAGGTGAELVTKATRFVAGRCDPLTAHGGDNVQRHATPLLQAAGTAHEQVPAGATSVTNIVPPALFGLGLLEAVSDADILAHENPAANTGDGIAGRAARTADHRVGRFGRKAEFATLADFIETAIRLEMGLTTPRHPDDERINGRRLPTGTDPAADPEVSQADVDAIVDFVRFLALPAPERTVGAAADSIARGERLFRDVGCSRCHASTFVTAPSAVPALDRRTLSAWSDLLLHDLGVELASNCSSDAAPSVWRTAPLMGIRHRKLLLHDGRALSIDGAVRLHGGEAQGVRKAYERLSPEQRVLLVRFVGSL